MVGRPNASRCYAGQMTCPQQFIIGDAERNLRPSSGSSTRVSVTEGVGALPTGHVVRYPVWAKQYRDLTGGVTVGIGAAVPINEVPILLETGSAR